MAAGSNWPLGLLGAIGGGVLGYFAFFFLVGQDLYAMVLPGALVGLGCGLLSGGRSTALGVVCAVLAVWLGLFVEWRFAPFKADDSFAYFITHVNKLKTFTLIMIGIGGLLGYWLGQGRERDLGHRHSTDAPE